MISWVKSCAGITFSCLQVHCHNYWAKQRRLFLALVPNELFFLMPHQLLKSMIHLSLFLGWKKNFLFLKLLVFSISVFALIMNCFFLSNSLSNHFSIGPFTYTLFLTDLRCKTLLLSAVVSWLSLPCCSVVN